jgi:putative transposase
MMGFKAFHSAQATIAGIETAHMIRKGQLSEENIPASIDRSRHPDFSYK